MTAANNLTAWERPDVVSAYEHHDALQPAESALIADLGTAFLSTARMLDMGVGAGRTTSHFAPIVREYHAMDYSTGMVELTAKRFPQLAQLGRIRRADARDLREYRTASFDLLLFSYNGLDYVSEEGRAQALREMARITKRGGYVAFSSHNLQCTIPRVLDFNRADGLRYGIRRTLTRFRFELSNPTLRWKRASADAMLVRDPGHNFQLLTLYVTPAAQVRALEAAGFSHVKLYGWHGQQVDAADSPSDPGIYYLARRL